MPTFDDVVETVWEEVQESGRGIAGEAAEHILATTDFKILLDEVEARARMAVVEETRKNAFTLFMFALAGGAIGGAVFRGGLGLIAAAGLSVWAASRLGLFEGVNVDQITSDISESVPGMGRLSWNPRYGSRIG